MSTIRFEGFVGATYEASSANANAERCVNLYPEFTGGTGKSKIHYRPTPGLQTYFELPSSPVRALWAGDSTLYAVAGTKYGELKYGGGAPFFEDRGTVANDGRRAYIHSNGNQLIIVSGGTLYCDNGGAATGANAVAQMTSRSGTYLDGYFVSLIPDTNEIQISDLLNGLSWSALEKQARLSSHDRLVAIATDKQNLWLFGTRNIDVWYNSGNKDFPFEPIRGASIRSGTVVLNSIEELDNSFFFVMEDERGGGVVVRTEGFNLQRISTHAIELRLDGSLYDRFTAWSYSSQGRQFYVLTEPGGTYTLCYDVTTGMWHERAYWDGAAFTPHLGRCHAYTTPGYTGLGGMHVVGSRLTGRVYTISDSLFTDDGAAIRRYRQAPHLASENKRIFYGGFLLDAHPLGPTGVTLKWSHDDGVTWTPERSPITPAAVDNRRGLYWPRLGSGRDRIFALTLHNIPTEFEINDAFIEAEVGTG